MNGVEHSLWQFFVDHHPGWLVDAAKLLSFVGDETVLFPVTLLVAVWALYRRRADMLTLAPFAAMVASFFVVGVLKILINRSRPPETNRLVEVASASMPSGHAAYSAALAMVVWIATEGRAGRKGWRVLAVTLAGFIGASRLVLAVHWVSDVLAGWVVGGLIGVCVVALLGRRLQSSR